MSIVSDDIRLLQYWWAPENGLAGIPQKFKTTPVKVSREAFLHDVCTCLVSETESRSL